MTPKLSNDTLSLIHKIITTILHRHPHLLLLFHSHPFLISPTTITPIISTTSIPHSAYRSSSLHTMSRSVSWKSSSAAAGATAGWRPTPIILWSQWLRLHCHRLARSSPESCWSRTHFFTQLFNARIPFRSFICGWRAWHPRYSVRFKMFTRSATKKTFIYQRPAHWTVVFLIPSCSMAFGCVVAGIYLIHAVHTYFWIWRSGANLRIDGIRRWWRRGGSWRKSRSLTKSVMGYWTWCCRCRFWWCMWCNNGNDNEWKMLFLFFCAFVAVGISFYYDFCFYTFLYIFIHFYTLLRQFLLS